MQIYGVAIVAVSVAQVLLWTAATRGGGRLIGGVTAGEYWAGLLRTASPGLVFVTVIVLIGMGQVDLARLAPLVIVPLVLVARVFAGDQPRKDKGPDRAGARTG
jgi:hypothetical protein